MLSWDAPVSAGVIPTNSLEGTMREFPKALYYRGRLKGTFVVFNSEWCMGLAKDADEEVEMLEAGFSLVMGEEPSTSAPEASQDDLTELSGVGSTIAAKLNNEGITRFSQIAAWTDEDVAAFDKKLAFHGRIEREGWIEQAKDLTG